jgi:uncharacterized coiled-coil DUF342 family protein
MDNFRYTDNLELDEKAQNLVDSKKKLKNEVFGLLKESKELNNKVAKLRKRISKIDNELKGICEHEWIREPQLYSDLYCKRCGVWR